MDIDISVIYEPPPQIQCDQMKKNSILQLSFWPIKVLLLSINNFQIREMEYIE